MLLADFTWDDLDPDTHDWDDACNWGGGFICTGPVPDDSGDTATFPDNSETDWEVLHQAYTIGTLTCEEGVDFTGTVTLTANKFVIDATGRTADLNVKITGSGGEIVANP